jgi:3-phosphoglycerate kinase
MAKLSVRQLPVKNQRVLVRADLNCPMSDRGEILDDTRIRASLPTLTYLLDQGVERIVLMSHLGRPDGKPQSSLSLAPIRKRLEELLGVPVALSPEILGPTTEDLVQRGKARVVLLENIRFDPSEEHPDRDPSFAQRLAALGNCYVNDAFGTAHRRHSSTVDLARHFPGHAAAGLLMEKELQYLQPILAQPKRPFVVILAGGKVSTKVGVIRSLVQKANTICLGGAMAQTFLASAGAKIGRASIETDAFALCAQIEALAASAGCKILLPVDLRYQVPESSTPVSRRVGDPVPDDWIPKDVGPETVRNFHAACKSAATVLWNGPLGVIEEPPFDASTRALARDLARLEAITIAGGGHTVAMIESENLQGHFSHVSTGGGATLELLEFGHLPGIDALSDVS